MICAFYDCFYPVAGNCFATIAATVTCTAAISQLACTCKRYQTICCSTCGSP